MQALRRVLIRHPRRLMHVLVLASNVGSDSEINSDTLSTEQRSNKPLSTSLKLRASKSICLRGWLKASPIAAEVNGS